MATTQQTSARAGQWNSYGERYVCPVCAISKLESEGRTCLNCGHNGDWIIRSRVREAAPALLAALKSARPVSTGWVLDEIESAIAAAEGR